MAGFKVQNVTIKAYSVSVCVQLGQLCLKSPYFIVCGVVEVVIVKLAFCSHEHRRRPLFMVENYMALRGAKQESFLSYKKQKR